MIGKIFIKNLTVKANVGEHVEERSVPQDILLNVAVWLDVLPSIKSEDITQTVDYCFIRDEIKNLLENNQYVLIETLASALIERCLKDKRIEKILVRVEKPHKLANCESVGIEIEKSR